MSKEKIKRFISKHKYEIVGITLAVITGGVCWKIIKGNEQDSAKFIAELYPMEDNLNALLNTENKFVSVHDLNLTEDEIIDIFMDAFEKEGGTFTVGD